MMDKQYGLSDPYGCKQPATDAPAWLEALAKRLEEPASKPVHPFAGLDDPILNPHRIGVEPTRRD